MKKTNIINVNNYQDFILNFKKLIDEFNFDDLYQDCFFIGIPKWSINRDVIINGNYGGFNFKGTLNEVTEWHEYELNSSFGVNELYEIIIKMSVKKLCVDFFYELADLTNEKFYFFIEGNEVSIKNIEWDKTTPDNIKKNFKELLYEVGNIDQLEDLEDLEDVFELIEPRDIFFNECVFELTFKESKLKNDFKLIWKEKQSVSNSVNKDSEIKEIPKSKKTSANKIKLEKTVLEKTGSNKVVNSKNVILGQSYYLDSELDTYGKVISIEQNTVYFEIQSISNGGYYVDESNTIGFSISDDVFFIEKNE